MSFFEDFAARHLHTYFTIKGKPYYLGEMIKLVLSPGSVEDLRLSVVDREGNHLAFDSAAERDLNLSMPDSTLVNTNLEAFWCTRRPDRQWKRTLCKGNAKSFSLTYSGHLIKCVYDYLGSTLNKELLGAYLNGLDKGTGNHDVWFNWLDPKFYTYQDALESVLSGKKISVAFTPRYALSLSYPSKDLTLFHKNLEVAKVSVEDPRKVRPISPVVVQELSDLSKRKSLDWEICA